MNYSLDCWYRLFTPSVLNTIDGVGSEHWVTYSKVRNSDMSSSIDSTLQTICESGWDEFLSQGSTAALEYLSDELFNAVNTLAAGMSKSSDYFAASGTPIWDGLIVEYFRSLSTKLKSGIKTQGPDDKAHVTLKLALIRKLQWMTHKHNVHHYAPVLPLLTPNSLDSLTQMFEQIPNALTEVCIYLYGYQYVNFV